MVHLSPFHFARAFRRATGLTLQQHVSNQRLRLAKIWLEAGGRSLTEIAVALSFSSAESFSKAFRRATGVPPGAYRRRFRPPR